VHALLRNTHCSRPTVSARLPAGPHPPCLRCPQIEDLYIRGTNISELPEAIGQLRRMRNLSASSCPMLRALPASVGKLTRLERLYVSRSVPICQCVALCVALWPQGNGGFANAKFGYLVSDANDW
jgi:hypothetical protein